MQETEKPSNSSVVEQLSHPTSEKPSAVLLEQGRVLYFPEMPFEMEEREKKLLSGEIGSGKHKNISFDPRTGALRGLGEGVSGSGATADLANMMRRFSNFARVLATSALPKYGQIEWGLTSFRPAEIAGRKTSWRKDDTRLHVDAFPTRPTQGRRILRVFANIGRTPRAWHLGEPFQDVATFFGDKLRLPLPGAGWLLKQLRLVKGHRSAYDHLMLQLHNSMKADASYQARAVREKYSFPPGATWMVFTDQVSHAALAGQFALEQTLFIPVEVLHDPGTAPLRVLEKKFGRKLV